MLPFQCFQTDSLAALIIHILDDNKIVQLFAAFSLLFRPICLLLNVIIYFWILFGGIGVAIYCITNITFTRILCSQAAPSAALIIHIHSNYKIVWLMLLFVVKTNMFVIKLPTFIGILFGGIGAIYCVTNITFTRIPCSQAAPSAALNIQIHSNYKIV